MEARVWLGVGGYGEMVELLVHVTRVCTNSPATTTLGKKTIATTFSTPTTVCEGKNNNNNYTRN